MSRALDLERRRRHYDLPVGFLLGALFVLAFLEPFSR